MMNPSPLCRIKWLARWPVPMDADGGYGAQRERKTPLPGFAGLRRGVGVGEREMGLVDCNSNLLGSLVVRREEQR